MVDYAYRFRLATTEAGLARANFFILELPRPQIAFFNDHSARRPQATGGEARLGYSVAGLQWERLDARQATTIQRLIDAAEAAGGGPGNGTLYLTLPRTLASGAWIDISGIVIKPDWANLVDPESDGRSYANVPLRFNNCTIENEPAAV